MAKLTSLKSGLQTQPSRLANINPDSWRAGKQTAAQRGYGYKWQKARVGWLEQHPLCVYCERNGLVTAGTIVDHIVEHRGDQALFWARSNWQTLCQPCHDIVKKAEEVARRNEARD
ncbi:HNH endonuclease signature motif containing protein [Pseudomonas sp. PS01303]|uniref:HNH endonuclease n=1 Tax=Pseudomonas sp. PS01303 TaxID=2991439 RepID=UPI00249B9130|nr:HNH endonuclease signature motif containing protein [Pseudomonas sp. PS01303]